MNRASKIRHRSGEEEQATHDGEVLQEVRLIIGARSSLECPEVVKDQSGGYQKNEEDPACNPGVKPGENHQTAQNLNRSSPSYRKRRKRHSLCLRKAGHGVNVRTLFTPLKINTMEQNSTE